MAEEFFYSLDCTVVLCSYSFSSSVDRPPAWRDSDSERN